MRADRAGLAAALGVEPDGVAELHDELVARHAEAHRRYHDLRHVGEVLAEAGRLLAVEPAAHARAVVLATWFHDAVHEPVSPPGASERASAALAQERLAPVAGDGLAAEVARLVRLTAGHVAAPDDRSGAVLVDADLWILSAPPSRYDRYVADVRAEHPHVDDDAWAAGRGAVLDRFLAPARAGTLYGAGPDDDRRARSARAAANLARERAALGPGPRRAGPGTLSDPSGRAASPGERGAAG